VDWREESGSEAGQSFVGTTAQTVFAVANAPTNGVFDEAMYSPSSGLAAASGALTVTAVGDRAVPDAASDLAAAEAPVTR